MDFILEKLLLLILIDLGFHNLYIVNADESDINKVTSTSQTYKARRLTSIILPATPRIRCFECDSRDDPQCALNLTSLIVNVHNKELLRIKPIPCSGSCVKMVVNANSSTEAYIRRSCTRNLMISHLTTLSDSVCIGNSSIGENELCLCFKSYCNSADKMTLPSWVTTCTISTVVLFYLGRTHYLT